MNPAPFLQDSPSSLWALVLKIVVSALFLHGVGGVLRPVGGQGGAGDRAPHLACEGLLVCPSGLLTAGESRFLGTLLPPSPEPARAPGGSGFSPGSCAQNFRGCSWASLTSVWGLSSPPSAQLPSCLAFPAPPSDPLSLISLHGNTLAPLSPGLSPPSGLDRHQQSQPQWGGW